MMEKSSLSIILRLDDLGEADRLVTFFTEDFGKFRGVAKNAKKSSRRFGGGLVNGTIGVVRFVEKSKTGLVRLEDIAVKTPVWKLALSLPRLVELHVSMELADIMLPAAHVSREKFTLLKRWIEFLADNQPTLAHRHAFFYKWLVASGLAPVLERCVLCGNDKSVLWRVAAGHGGMVCKSCYRAGYGGITASDAVLRYLRGLKVGKISGTGSADADKIFEELITHAVGKRLKSLDVAKKLLNG